MFHANQPSPYSPLTIGALLGWITAYFATPVLTSHCPPGSQMAPVLGILLLPLCILCGILLAGVLSATQLPLRELLRMRHPMPLSRRLPNAFLWAIGLFLLLQLGCGGFLQWLLKLLGLAPSQQPLADFLKNNATNPIVLGAVFLSSCILSPISEELFYRRLLPQTFLHLGIPLFVVIPLVAMLFGIVHLLLWAFPGLFLFSLALFYTTWRHDLIQAILIHAGYNILTLLSLLLTVLL